MNDDIAQDLVDKMMVKCGRHCCICRRFNMGLTICVGDRNDFITRGDRRSEAKYKQALDQLVSCGLAEQDQIMVRQDQPPA
jgi:hypothetical protein